MKTKLKKTKPKRAAEKPMTRKQLIRKLKFVSREMLKLGNQMQYLGGFGDLGEFGRDVIFDAEYMKEWAEGMES